MRLPWRKEPERSSVSEVVQTIWGLWVPKPEPGESHSLEAVAMGLCPSIPAHEVNVNLNGRAFHGRWFQGFRYMELGR